MDTLAILASRMHEEVPRKGRGTDANGIQVSVVFNYSENGRPRPHFVSTEQERNEALNTP